MYTPKDVEILVNAFSSISPKNVKDVKYEDISPLLDYPEGVVQEFINCMKCIPTNIGYVKENYRGILVYIAIRLNLV